jgi:hypothetical protein
MKDTDKVTMTLAQLKKLVSEGKAHKRIVKEGVYQDFYDDVYGLVQAIESIKRKYNLTPNMVSNLENAIDSLNSALDDSDADL